jgi:hypothetical protein
METWRTIQLEIANILSGVEGVDEGLVITEYPKIANELDMETYMVPTHNPENPEEKRVNLWVVLYAGISSQRGGGTIPLGWAHRTRTYRILGYYTYEADTSEAIFVDLLERIDLAFLEQITLSNNVLISGPVRVENVGWSAPDEMIGQACHKAEITIPTITHGAVNYPRGTV